MSGLTLATAVTPSENLGQDIVKQIDYLKAFWDQQDELAQQPFTEDIVCYSESVLNRKLTFSDLIRSTRNALVRLVAAQYSALQTLNDLALLQSIRCNSLAKGKISPEVYLKQTGISLSYFVKESGKVSAIAVETLNDLHEKVDLTRKNVEDLTKAITLAENDLKSSGAASRDKATGLLLQTTLNGYSTGALLGASINTAAYGTPLGSIIPVILGKQDRNGQNRKRDLDEVERTWTAMRTQIRSIRDSPASLSIGKALYGKLSLENLTFLVSIVSVTMTMMQSAAEGLDRTAKCLQDIVDSIRVIATTISDLSADLDRFKNDILPSNKPAFGQEEATLVSFRWEEVKNACESWSDLVNSRGIAPRSGLEN